MVRPVTFESCDTFAQAEFAAWLDRYGGKDDSRYELLNGRIVVTPPAGWPHGESETAFVEHLRRFVRERQLGRVFGSSQGFELPSGDTVAPDAAFVSTARWSAAPRPEAGKFLKVVPDLVVEVLSPGTASRDRGEKKAIYERNGVSEYWLVDPVRRDATRFVLRGERFDGGQRFGDGDAFASEVLPEFQVPLVELFPEP